MVRFCPIVSGSDGNSVYIGTEYTNILIDAGLSGKKIEEGLKQIDVLAQTLDGIFVTHEHIDHIQGVGVLSRRYDLPIFATVGTWNAMESLIGNVSRKNKKIIYSGERMEFNDLIINPFSISHDAAEPVGYSVLSGNVKMAVATDIGHVTDTVKEGVADCDILLVESNHDVGMLETGPYPYYLRQRILGNKGHLSNDTAGVLLSEMVTSRLKHVFLGHLSNENNRPDLAYKTVEELLYQNKIRVGKDFTMDIASRKSTSRCVQL